MPEPQDFALQPHADRTKAPAVPPLPSGDDHGETLDSASPAAGEVDISSRNRLIRGENLLVVQALLAQICGDKTNLINAGLSFNFKNNYNHSIHLYLMPEEADKDGGKSSLR